MSHQFFRGNLARPLPRLIAAALAVLAVDALAQENESPTELKPIVVTGSRDSGSGVQADERELAARRNASSDTTRLFDDIGGMSSYGAGGISGLPVVRGLADDRLRVQVDGMDLSSACPNHMNSPLSYINPTKVATVSVFAGITPVSLGGDSIGGTIQVKSAPPKFVAPDEPVSASGELGGFYRSNGNAHGYNLGATFAAERVSLAYSESKAQSGNYRAADSFKAAGIGSILPGGHWLDGDEVGSSAYHDSRNQDFSIALRHAGHVLQLSLGEQRVGFEGYPNQRMDMTSNRNTLANLRYTGNFDWGLVEARLYRQDTEHAMDMGPDRFFYGFGMPMLTEARTRGGQLSATLLFAEVHLLRVGAETLRYRLDDWWPPVGASGSMCCENFWNVRDGRRDRTGAFAEWEANWTPAWLTLLGVRGDVVRSDVGKVQGYNPTMGIWRTDAQNFNAREHSRTDHHLDWTALARFAPDERQTYEWGVARKTRSPNLYERYPWSSNAMAALMNNFVGDGNGYIGNPDLRPEVAHTVSVSGDWHDASREAWQLKANAYLTYVDDFIDARRCNFGQCSAANRTTTTGFVLLQYVNQSARLYGYDLSGRALLGRSEGLGSLTVTGMLNFVRGENRSTGDNLYHQMPLNSKLGLQHRLGGWSATAEVQMVSAKTRVSQVRNEVRTDRYSLVNLRAGYEFKHARVEVGVDNLFDTFYYLPLGGAYVGQGMSMSTNTIPWGVTVPGMGRSVNAALTLRF